MKDVAGNQRPGLWMLEQALKKIYVGNLSYDTTDDGLREAFAVYGSVASASVIRDRETGRSRGFGFVEMPQDAEAEAAISAMHGSQLDDRTLTVNEARPREDRGGRRPGGYTGGGYGAKQE